MRRNIWNKLFLLMLLAVFSACKSKKQMVPAAPVSKPEASIRSKASLSPAAINNFTSTSLSFNSLSAKARATLAVGGADNDVSLSLRVQHGEKIWVSVTAIAGIEVARALITPDSIHVLNRLQSVYLCKPFSFIHQYANNQLSFAYLEALLLGNVLPGTPKSDDELSQKGGLNVVNGNAGALIYTMLFNTDNKLIENTLRDAGSARSLTAGYGSFQTLGGMKMPATVAISSEAQSKPVRISLQYSAVQLNQQLEFPFSVPRRYDIIR